MQAFHVFLAGLKISSSGFTPSFNSKTTHLNPLHSTVMQNNHRCIYITTTEAVNSDFILDFSWTKMARRFPTASLALLT